MTDLNRRILTNTSRGAKPQVVVRSDLEGNCVHNVLIKYENRSRLRASIYGNRRHFHEMLRGHAKYYVSKEGIL